MKKSVKAVYISALKSPRASLFWRGRHLETIDENLEYTELISKIKNTNVKTKDK